MRRLVPVLAFIVLAASLAATPKVAACSLAYIPYQHASWEEDLHFVDGGALRQVRNGVEATLVEGFFLSYATDGDVLLVGGQDGLGADCSGEGWLRLQRAGTVLWEKEGMGRVFADADGPIAVHDGQAFRLDGRELAPLGIAVEQGHYVLGWTPDAKPVYRSTETPRAVGVVVGDTLVPFDDVGSFEPAVSRNDAATAFTFQRWTTEPGPVEIHEVRDGAVRSRSWPGAGAEGGHEPGIAWADAWYVVGGGRAFHVPAGDGPVTDLGVKAVAVTSRDGRAVVFTERGYTVYEGTVPVEMAQRTQGGVWLPDSALPVPRTVDAEPWRDDGPGEQVVSPPPPPRASPGLGAPLVAVVVAALAAASRRR